MAPPLFYVTLTALTGESVAVNPGLVSTLAPVPVELLPFGVPAGTYIEDVDTGGRRLAVVGTVAQVNALLSGQQQP